MRIRLSDEDRARLECPEWLDVDVEHYPVELAEAIEEAGGNWRAYRSSSAHSIRLWVWAGLRNAGIDVPLNELTFDLHGVVEDADAAGDAGKDLSPDSDGSTPPD